MRAAPCVKGSWGGGGLLIHPDLFAQTDFCLFCLRNQALTQSEASFAVYCSARVPQNNCPLFLTLTGRVPAIISGLPTIL
jgi:hypothetical protein